MTEDEMKTLICHKTLAPVASADGSAPWFSPADCMGSACMAFRLADKIETITRDGGLTNVITTFGAGCYCADLKRDA